MIPRLRHTPHFMHRNGNGFRKLGFLEAAREGNLTHMRDLYPHPFGLVSRGRSAVEVFDMLLIVFGDIHEDTTQELLDWVHAQMELYLTDPSNQGETVRTWIQQRLETAFRSAIHQGRLDLLTWFWNLALSGALLLEPQSAETLITQKDYRPFRDACIAEGVDMMEFVYDTAYIHKVPVPETVLTACWLTACVEGHLEVAKWLYHKASSIGIQLETGRNTHSLVTKWALENVGGWVLLDDDEEWKESQD